MAALKHYRMLPLLLLHFLCQWRFVVAQQCSLVDGQPNCVCDTGGDGIVNITSLANTDTPAWVIHGTVGRYLELRTRIRTCPDWLTFYFVSFSDIKGPSNYKYSYNPCFGFTDANDQCKQTAVSGHEVRTWYQSDSQLTQYSQNITSTSILL